jgi:hypothetical protein
MEVNDVTIESKEILKIYPVIRQRWEESERGWGIRPDGYSLHLTYQDAIVYIREYWDLMPSYVPDEYSRPSGEPTEAMVERQTFEALNKAREEGKRGLRF